MPRLESITVSHSILSLTCDRNKAVLKATFSPACAALRLLAVPAAVAAAAAAPGSERTGMAPAGCGAPARHSGLLRSQPCPPRHSWPFPGIFTAIFSSSRDVGLRGLHYTVNKKCRMRDYTL